VQEFYEVSGHDEGVVSRANCSRCSSLLSATNANLKSIRAGELAHFWDDHRRQLELQTAFSIWCEIGFSKVAKTSGSLTKLYASNLEYYRLMLSSLSPQYQNATRFPGHDHSLLLRRAAYPLPPHSCRFCALIAHIYLGQNLQHVWPMHCASHASLPQPEASFAGIWL
jgi:hypothetical protein